MMRLAQTTASLLLSLVLLCACAGDMRRQHLEAQLSGLPPDQALELLAQQAAQYPDDLQIRSEYLQLRRGVMEDYLTRATTAYDANDLAPVGEAPDGKLLTDAAPTTHHFTPSNIMIDALGRTVEAIARNGLDPSEQFRTQSTYDIRGNVLSVTDALSRVAFRYGYDLANRPWRNESIDAGLSSAG